jgi:hypothetical protein
LRRKIIYLDQFVISNLMKLVTPSAKGHEKVKADAFWQELHDLLIQLRHLQLIVCPYSESHENESLVFEFGDALKKMYKDLGSGNSFQRFDSIKSQQIGELAHAWSEEREPKFDFDPSDVLERNPNGWNERFYITTGNNPFVKADELRRVRNAMHAIIARLFTNVWSVEKHDFAYWYDLECKGYQGWLRKAVIQSREERVKALLAYSPGREISLENLNATLPSFAEALCASIEHIMRFPRDGTERTPEERSALEKSFGDANRIAEAPFVKLSSLMYAAIAMRAASGQKEPPDTGTTTDIDTVSHLIPYCDVMFIDNGCRVVGHCSWTCPRICVQQMPTNCSHPTRRRSSWTAFVASETRSPRNNLRRCERYMEIAIRKDCSQDPIREKRSLGRIYWMLASQIDSLARSR